MYFFVKSNDYEKALDFTKKYMNYLTKDDKYNNRLYNIGVSLEFLGRRNEALDYYKQVRGDFNDDNEWEKYHYRKLIYRRDHPMTPIDSLLIAADNNRA